MIGHNPIPGKNSCENIPAKKMKEDGTHSAILIQYSQVVRAAHLLPNARFTQAYNPPCSGYVEPNSAVIRP